MSFNLINSQISNRQLTVALRKRYMNWPKPFSIAVLFFLLTSCTKLISISPPTSTITTEEVFADSADATAALLGLYSSAGSTGNNLYLTNGGLSLYTGSSSDELVNFLTGVDANYLYINAIISNNGTVENYFWVPAYKIIYNANACIEGVQSASGISQATKNKITGEAKFLRAFVDFYLVNLFGDIPLINTTDHTTNALLPRTPAGEVYASIDNDLHDAESLLPPDYSASPGSRTRVNSKAATALLARYYLYQGKYDSAESEANKIINNTS